MQILTLKDILRATEGEIISKTGDVAGLEIDGITTDSRNVRSGVLFIPLVGDRFDGHDFINSAIKHGAGISLTQKDISRCDGTIIRVKDTRRALGDIARYYMNKYRVPSVAITGSVGKTTTKDIIYAVLAEHFNTLKTSKNFNNDIGVPLTVFSLESHHEAAVIEMGMNHFGEIEYLSGIVRPDAAVITNIGMSHIENLGSQEGILKAKTEITKQFTDKNTLFINGDDKLLNTIESNTFRIVRFGLDDTNDIYAKDIVSHGLDGVEFTVVTKTDEFRARVMQPGVHNVYNALAAVAVGMNFGVSADECVAGLANCEYTSQRLEVIRNGGIEIINDCYNSSPDSIRAALKVQTNTTKLHRVAILGDVLEMGSYAKQAHYDLGADVVDLGVDKLITAGENAAELARGARDAGMTDIVSYATTAELTKDISKLVRDGDSVLVKASHGMRFEQVTEAIKSL